MSNLTLKSITYDGLSFTNFSIAETDIGSYAAFTTYQGVAQAAGTPYGIGIVWGGVNAGVYGANSSEVVNFNYTVSSTSASTLIGSVSQLYTADTFSGPGVSLTAVEQITSTTGVLLATDTFTLGATNLPVITMSSPQQVVDVQITLTMAISSAGSTASSVVISAFQQTFGTEAAPATASIGDIAFVDMDATGVESAFDSGPGLAGVTVELLNGTGSSVLATTTTDAGGRYSFSGLAAGVYEVEFVGPAGYTLSSQGVGSNPGLNSSPNATTGITAAITLTSSEADHDVEAGFVPVGSAAGGTATIGNTVWMDTNHDGLDDNGEAGVAGVAVQLLSAATGNLLSTTTTNSSGNYQFSNLAAAVYEVQFVLPSGDSFTTQNASPGSSGDLNSVVASSGLTAPITITAGQIDNAVNVGLIVSGSISGVTFLDNNKNDVLDASDTLLAGQTVQLLNSAGTTVATTTTNSSAAYSFTNLNPGTYDVQFVTPTGDTIIAPRSGFTTTGSTAGQASGLSPMITLRPGGNQPNVNAGFQVSPADIRSYVFMDGNRNGIMDGADYFVSGVTIELLNATGGSVLATTTTNSGGLYSFTNLNPGSYEIEAILPNGDAFAPQRAAVANATINNTSAVGQTTGVTPAVTLTAGQDDYNVLNVGLQMSPAAITGSAFLDTNRDGIKDAGDTVLPCVTVALWNAAETSVLATTTTDASGNYSFANLAPATYDVSFATPSGDSFTTQGTPFGAADSSASATTGFTPAIVLTAGQTRQNVNVGFQVGKPGISVLKLPATVAIAAGGSETYCFIVTNTGATALSNITISDNLGTPSTPSAVTPTLMTKGTNGVLAPGQSWTYSQTIQEPTFVYSGGTVSCTASGNYLGSGCTAWLSTSFKPVNCGNGATYTFSGVTCTIGGSGVSSPFTVNCPTSIVKFSGNCTSATTVFNASTNCWTTTLPANCNPGSVFLSGCPVTLPNGCNLSGASINWSCATAANNCGVAALNWNGSCVGYANGNLNGLNCMTDYNQLGVKACDSLAGYGNGGSCLNGPGTPQNPYMTLNCGVPASALNGYCASNGPSSTLQCITYAATPSLSRTDTVTVSGMSASTGTTVTASDTKEIQVLATNTDIGVNGTVPAGSLSALYGAPTVMEFQYNPANTMSSAAQGSVSGSNTASSAFMVISNTSNASIYFEGNVTAGENVYADATWNSLTNTVVNGGTFAGTDAGTAIFARIYSSQAAFQSATVPVQVDAINVPSGSLHMGDTFGSVKLDGYVGPTGGHLSA